MNAEEDKPKKSAILAVFDGTKKVSALPATDDETEFDDGDGGWTEMLAFEAQDAIKMVAWVAVICVAIVAAVAICVAIVAAVAIATMVIQGIA